MTMPTFTDGVVVHQASLNSLSTGINNLNTVVTGAVAPRAYVPMVRLRRVNAQNITTGTNTTVSWDTIDVNTDNMFTLVSPTQITVQTAGSYALDVEWGWTLSSAGDRVIWGTKNGTSTTANSVCTDEQHGASLITGRGNTMHIATVLPNCVVGDTFFVVVFQNSGGTLTSITSGFQPVSSLSMWRIGP
jgi:hypothetical protein